MKQTSLSNQDQEWLLQILQERFEAHRSRHPEVEWKEVSKQLLSNPKAMLSLFAMEKSGGEPDVVALTDRKGKLVFVDCSAETPKGRVSTCYDQAALEARKEHKPADSAMHMAETMGIQILDEPQYRNLQEFGEFDRKTSSWILTPADIRKAGGALFCDQRYGHVFTYHNGVQSYYASRGFRGFIEV